MKFNIGDKVIFGHGESELVGYIVEIAIDPLTEIEVNFEKENLIMYTIRVYKPFYRNGYADFGYTEKDMRVYNVSLI